jgi:hypothetical protein
MSARMLLQYEHASHESSLGIAWLLRPVGVSLASACYVMTEQDISSRNATMNQNLVTLPVVV